MTEQKDTYSIVVVGAMNPRIHHPSWYRLVGLFDDEDTDRAVREPNTLTTMPVAQIQTPQMTIICQDNRWEIRTNYPAQTDRLRHIASRLFDDILPHTPVTALGFNFTYLKATDVEDTGKFLAGTIISTPLGLKGDHAAAGEVVLRRRYEDHTASVHILQPIEDKTKLAFAYNFEYTFLQEGAFNLGEVIRRRYGVDQRETEEETALILQAFNHSARG